MPKARSNLGIGLPLINLTGVSLLLKGELKNVSGEVKAATTETNVATDQAKAIKPCIALKTNGGYAAYQN